MSEYYLTNDCDAYCGITFETLNCGFIEVEYDINGIDIWETNWENLGKMLQTLHGWEEEVMYVINKCRGINWIINIGSLTYNDKDVYIGCYGNDGPTIDLGKLAECYDDCETCTECHNYTSVPCRECEGCHEHPCIKVNGRASLEAALARKEIWRD